MTQLSIEMLPAAHGDALWVEWAHEGRPHRVLIDGGPGKSYAALRSRGHDAVKIFVDRDLDQVLRQSAIDVAFLALHGRYGEDGCVQRVRDWDVVFVAAGDVFEAQPVELGRRDARVVEIVSGLAPGQAYVAAGSFALKAEAGKSGASHDH